METFSSQYVDILKQEAADSDILRVWLEISLKHQNAAKARINTWYADVALPPKTWTIRYWSFLL
jgi:hypothetical protein